MLFSLWVFFALTHTLHICILCVCVFACMLCVNVCVHTIHHMGLFDCLSLYIAINTPSASPTRKKENIDSNLHTYGQSGSTDKKLLIAE